MIMTIGMHHALQSQPETHEHDHYESGGGGTDNYEPIKAPVSRVPAGAGKPKRRGRPKRGTKWDQCKKIYGMKLWEEEIEALTYIGEGSMAGGVRRLRYALQKFGDEWPFPIPSPKEYAARFSSKDTLRTNIKLPQKEARFLYELGRKYRYYIYGSITQGVRYLLAGANSVIKMGEISIPSTGEE